MTPLRVDLGVGGETIVRLDGVGRSLAGALVRRLGATADRHSGRPAVVVRGASARVGERGGGRSPVPIGRDDAVWTDDDRLTVRAGGGWASLREPADDRSVEVEVEVSEGVDDPGLCAGLVQLALLRRGCVPLHAAAFRVGGRLVAAGGWSGGGKTAALLAMVRAGAEPAAGEWIYLRSDGRIGFGAHAVRVRAAHLRGSESGLDPLSPLLPIAALDRTAGLVRRAASVAGPAREPIGRLAAALERRASVDVPIEDLRGTDEAPDVTSDGPLAAVVVVARGGASATEVRSIEREPLVRRLAAAFEEDLEPVAAAARRFGGITGRDPTWATDWRARYRSALAERLDGVVGFEVLRSAESGPDELAAAIRRGLS